jgi:hypothetical protein
VCCGSEEHEQGKLRIATSAFGTSYIALLSHFLRPTKRINIHFFREHCVEELQEIQISHLEVKFKEHREGKAWTRQQEWLLWVSGTQYKQLKNDFHHGGKICLLIPSQPCPKH